MASSARSTRWIDPPAWLFLLLVLLSTWAPDARAQAKPDEERLRNAQAIAEQGFAAYDRKEYGDAIHLFEKAYRLAPATALLYNIAQAYRMLGDSGCETALEHYQRYLDELKAQGAQAPEGVKARIVEMKECVERMRERAAAVEPQAVVTSAPTIVSTPDGRRGGRRTAGWIVSGLGAAAMAAAAVTGGIALKRESDLLDRCEDGRCPEDSELRDDVGVYNRFRVTAFVSGAVGVAALATGVWLLMTSRPDETRSSSHARAGIGIAPWVGAGSLGLRGDF